MEVLSSEYLLEYDGKTFCGNFNGDKRNEIIDSRISVAVESEEDFLYINLKNICSEEVCLNKLQLCFRGFDYKNFKGIFLNPENPSEKIIRKDFAGKNKGEYLSQLFSVLEGEIQSESLLLGFMGCFISKNYINVAIEKNIMKIYVVYEFFRHVLSPCSSINTDKLYLLWGNGYIQLMSRYVNMLKDKKTGEIWDDGFKERSTIKSQEEMLLYSERPSEYVISNKGKPVSLNIKGKKYYLLNICDTEARGIIIERIRDLKNMEINIINVSRVYDYIKEAESIKCFNPYYEFNRLLMIIRKEFPEMLLSFEDCPVGLVWDKNIIFKQKLNLDIKESLVSKLGNKQTSGLDHSFIIKTLMQNLNKYHHTEYELHIKKFKELIEAISDNYFFDIRNTLFFDIRKDLVHEKPIIPHMNKEGVLGLLIMGYKNIYIAMFNFSNKPQKFFWDFSEYLDENININISGIEIYTNKNLLISSNTVYLKEIPSKECYLAKFSV